MRKNIPEILVYPLIVVTIILIIVFANSEIVGKINNYANLLLSVLTAGYVFLTFWILKTTRQAVFEQARAYVVVSMPLEDHGIWLSIKNIGNRPAFRVKVNITPSLSVLGGKDAAWMPLLSQPFIAPGAEVRNVVAEAFDTLTLPQSSKAFQIEIEYFDEEQVKYPTKPYKIDLSSYTFKDLVISRKSGK